MQEQQRKLSVWKRLLFVIAVVLALTFWVGVAAKLQVFSHLYEFAFEMMGMGGTAPVSQQVEQDTSDTESLLNGVRVADFGENMENYDAAMAVIDQAVRNLEPEVYVRNIGSFDWSNLDPSYFWVSGMSSFIQTIQIGDHQVDAGPIYFAYNCEQSEIPAMQAEIDRVCGEILSLVPQGASQWETARILHDEICRRVTFQESTEGTHIRDIYGALVEESAVCMGYAYAFEYLLDQEVGDGFCQTLFSDTHAWNEISLNDGGQVYSLYVDSTWDDQDIQDADGREYVSYDYFCITGEEMGALEEHEMDSSLRGTEGAQYSYHARMGYLLNSCDQAEIVRIFSQQKEAGSNLLTVRFEKEEDYNRVKEWYWGENSNECNEIMSQIGYYDAYYFWTEDNQRTVNIRLNIPQG